MYDLVDNKIVIKSYDNCVKLRHTLKDVCLYGIWHIVLIIFIGHVRIVHKIS